MLPGELVFDIADVCFSYRGHKALSGLSVQVHRGERIALIGANGSGKSTLLRLLAGLSFPDSGGISLFGEELTEERLEEEEYFFRFRRRVGILFQNPDVQLFNASVFDEIAFGPLQMGWPRDQIRNLVNKTLEEMRIADLRDRAPHRLSGGEKKRVALASVLVLDPEVLLLDEPTAALDPHSDDQMINLLKSWANGKKTVITATHDLDTLEDIADRCYVLDNGRIAAEGAPLTILHDTRMLAAAKLVRPQHHTHSHGVTKPHPHVHTSDIG
ncbi:MAG: energy-coupling factor ABC transporter ATP-binding protein [Acidobacteriota bacterium]|nr:energy-coupling factor ABC transporter ATP-binding protein [Acidobacteriota bacterium]